MNQLVARLRGARPFGAVAFGALPFVALVLVSFHSCGTRSYLAERLGGGHLFSLPTEVVVADHQKFSFAVVGDLHIGGQNTSRLDRILSDAKTEGDAFVILLGDIIDKGEEEDFKKVRDSIDQSGLPVFPAIGNHDVFGNGWEFYEKYLGPSRYSFIAGNSRFIVLDTADATVGEEQKEWLESELSVKRSVTATHTFLASHYLPVIPGIRTYLKLSSDREAIRLMKLAQNFGVRAWLGAHYHSFVVGRVGAVDYVVAGGGGGRRMDPILSFFFVQAKIDGAAVSYELREVP